jgi:hypothetical protein
MVSTHRQTASSTARTWAAVQAALADRCPWNKCISLIGTQSEGDRGGYAWSDIGNDLNGEEPFNVKACMNWCAKEPSSTPLCLSCIGVL